MANIKQVSELAGVSSATVSHVINDSRKVSAATRAKVEAAIEQLDFHPNYIARTLRLGRSNTIGLILPDTQNPYFTELAWRIEQEAYANNYSVIMCNTKNTAEKERFYIDVLLRRQVDGIAFITCGDYADSDKLLLRSHIPAVMIDRDSGNLRPNSTVIMSDEELGARLAVDHLAELGHRTIACVTGGDAGQIASDKRFRGFSDAMHKHGLEVNPELVVGGDYQMKSGYEAGLRLLGTAKRPTAIFAFNDLMAFGVMRAAAECGVAVPEELSVVGFDDIEMASYIVPQLTTVSQQKDEIAKRVLSALKAMIEGNTESCSRTVLEPFFIQRCSCAAPCKNI